MNGQVLLENSFDERCKSLTTDLDRFCRLQAEQLVFHAQILFVKILYSDPIQKQERIVTSSTRLESDSIQAELADFRSEEWLIEFPPAFTINEVEIENFNYKCYICPIGYKNQKLEYILVFTHKKLCLNLQNHIKQTAESINNYLNIFAAREHQQSTIQVLEHIIHRIGHQLRHPLGSIGLYAQNLCLGLPSGTWQEQAAIIREIAQDLDRNITELIYCGQKAKLKVALQDLRGLILESIQSLQPSIEQKRLQINYPNISTNLAVDRWQMKQVFDNLLSNAIHFSPVASIITWNWQIFQDEILIQISDRGCGLSPEDLQKIFNPFYSRRSGGTGLGLTIAKKIVLDHQGSIWGQNFANGGAQFCLSLPR